MLEALKWVAAWPLWLLHWLGALLGWAAYLSSPGYRQNLRQNLAQAFPQDGGRRYRHAAIAQIGRAMTELPVVWLRPQAEVVALVHQVSGWEHVEAAWQQQQGIIVITPHLGCFEIIAQYYAARAPITALYRPPKLSWLQPLIENGRGGAGLHLARADVGGVRLLLRALKRHEAIGMLPDQAPKFGEGIWANFFGRPAYTMTLAARLTMQPQTAPLFFFAERLPHGAGFHLHIYPPQPPLTGTLEERVQAINHGLEKLIRQCPEQYLWSYNRYKIPAGVMPPPAC